MHASEALAEADRLMTICNSCRYCEGLCAVFPAMEMRRSFVDGDLDYLAHLCHACGACFHDCQFSPPHDFNVNVPRSLAMVRRESYTRYVWPKILAPVFMRNALMVAGVTIVCVAIFLVAFLSRNDWASASGMFYDFMPHHVIALVFGAAFLYAVLAISQSLGAFWRETGGGTFSLGIFLRAIADAGRLRYLDGGGAGCSLEPEAPHDWRRFFHHLTFYGFLLCFASTSVATVYHYVLDRPAPYPWWDLPVILGTLGGLGLVAGPIGLLYAKARRDPALQEEDKGISDKAFILTLLGLGISGLALMLLRATPAMSMLLAIHLGAVLAFFLIMPYMKFLHGFYRLAALLRNAGERSNQRNQN